MRFSKRRRRPSVRERVGVGLALSLCAVLGLTAPSTGYAQTFQVLHYFASEGSGPRAHLLQASDGNLYDTTPNGGAYARGSVFSLKPDGTGGFLFAPLYSFGGVRPLIMYGADPDGSLIQASDGNLYGTTLRGGDTNCGSGAGCGTVFRMTLTGTLTTLYRFHGSDGDQPSGTLVEASDGALYGTTLRGGLSGGCD